ncbi:PTS sugar transporter subunit IIA [Sporolactobacillus vineae]|uniref:PTS sugar transporter subunit IIA n=1 Tax=Sporolactobacillus vineae TaxID=444463 RepID=UPI000288801A|nr:PTS sugar transporter subunit IIA [Sporolactobacillus vineae]
MYSIIVCAHGDLAESFKRSAEMIFGKTDKFYPVRFVPGENLEDIKKKISAVISQNNLTDVLILADLFCGSPYNAAAAIAFDRQSVEVVSGVNLSIILEAVSGQNTSTLAEIVAHIKKIAPDTVKSFRDVLAAQESEESL